jgi:hypothetical protein
MVVRSPLLKAYFRFLLALALLNLGLLVSNSDFRNAIGVVDDGELDSYLLRYVPPTVLLIFYLCIVWIIHKGIHINRAILVVHSSIFTLLGLVSLIPFVGYISTLVTPIHFLYLAFIIWIPNLALATAVVVIFVILNVYALVQFAFPTRPTPLP